MAKVLLNLPVEFAANGFRLPSGEPNKCVADNLV